MDFELKEDTILLIKRDILLELEGIFDKQKAKEFSEKYESAIIEAINEVFSIELDYLSFSGG